MNEFPWDDAFGDNEKVDHKLNGYEVSPHHSGQKKRYGDSFYEFKIKSQKEKSEIEKYCTEYVYKCNLTKRKYVDDLKEDDSMKNHFRQHYVFRALGCDEFFYQVISVYCD